MITPVRGLLLDDNDAVEVRRALEVLAAMLPKIGQRPSAKLDALMAKFPKPGVSASDSASRASADARNTGNPEDSGDGGVYAIVDTNQAAAMLGVTPNAIRDRARRGTLPARRTAGGWIFAAAAIAEVAARR